MLHGHKKRNTSDYFPQGSLRQVRLSAIANREITVRHAPIFPVGPTCIERFLLERQRRRRTKGSSIGRRRISDNTDPR
jgi:hypothetical protein